MLSPKTVDWDYWVTEIHFRWAVPCGWWTDLETGERLERDWSEACLLIVTEVAEATEGLRKGLMDDKLPHRPMIEVELADVLIRLCDMAGGFKFKPFEGYPGSEIVTFDAESKTGQLMEIVGCVTDLHVAGDKANASTMLIYHIFKFCDMYDYDIIGAMKEKHQFNKVRADHKLENRKKDGGKKF